jgi:hypothetical protein
MNLIQHRAEQRNGLGGVFADRAQHLQNRIGNRRDRRHDPRHHHALGGSIVRDLIGKQVEAQATAADILDPAHPRTEGVLQRYWLRHALHDALHTSPVWQLSEKNKAESIRLLAGSIVSGACSRGASCVTNLNPQMCVGQKISWNVRANLEQLFGRCGLRSRRLIWRNGWAAPSAARNTLSTASASHRLEPCSSSTSKFFLPERGN